MIFLVVIMEAIYYEAALLAQREHMVQREHMDTEVEENLVYS